jgi:hypothetical protein
MKIILEPTHITKEEKDFLIGNEISFEGLKKIYRRETGYDYREIKILIQNYLSKKIMVLRMKKRNFEKEIELYNEAVDMSKQLEINSNINGEALKKMKLEFLEVF